MKTNRLQEERNLYPSEYQQFVCITYYKSDVNSIQKIRPKFIPSLVCRSKKRFLIVTGKIKCTFIFEHLSEGTLNQIKKFFCASILKDWSHHTFISCFFHILRARKQISSQDSKSSIGLGTHISNMRVPFQITSNCLT